MLARKIVVACFAWFLWSQRMCVRVHVGVCVCARLLCHTVGYSAAGHCHAVCFVAAAGPWGSLY